ncbi:helix-turn-helix domain-containing protein [Streptomyces sp. NPDC058469]|uniref:helix-turn-helix domain-containing protein n=1 Tax=Streptomyces sp. NPDC058469 TaxID=3346514 RepID=UPI0036542FFA
MIGSVYRTLPGRLVPQGSSVLYMLNQLGASIHIAVVALLTQNADGEPHSGFQHAYLAVVAALAVMFVACLFVPGPVTVAPQEQPGEPTPEHPGARVDPRRTSSRRERPQAVEEVMALSDQWIEVLPAPERDRLTVAEVCRRHGISRKTFYVHLARYRAEGPAGRCPAHAGRRTPRPVPRRTSSHSSCASATGTPDGVPGVSTTNSFGGGRPTYRPCRPCTRS